MIDKQNIKYIKEENKKGLLLNSLFFYFQRMN